jgi:hypothetical protein
VAVGSMKTEGHCHREHREHREGVSENRIFILLFPVISVFSVA